MNEKNYSIPWEQYAGEAEHYSYVRCLDLGQIYEVVRVTHEKHGLRAEFVHQVIFMDEYDEQALTEILGGFGYKSLDAFVCEANHADVDPAGFVTRQDGSIDREASPSWWIDYMLLSSLMAEHFDGLDLPVRTADALADSIVCKAPDTVIGPYRIRRMIADQRTTIPPTEEEARETYVVTVIRQRFEGQNMELYRSSYRIDRDRLSNPSEEACETYLRKIVSDFLRTEDGKRAYESTCRDFNWGDVETEIPSSFFSAYGVAPFDGGPNDSKFLCCGGFAILVNQDELLGQGVYDDGEAEP